MEKKFNFFWKKFSELNSQELYEVLLLREAVFQIEQQCLYPDLDGQDQGALHLLAYDNNMLAGYLRLFTPDSALDIATNVNIEQAGAYTDKSTCRFGRFATHKDYRGCGLGKRMVRTVLNYCEQSYPKIKIVIAAQAYLEPFYQSFGFITQGKPYDDFGILHIDMSR